MTLIFVHNFTHSSPLILHLFAGQQHQNFSFSFARLTLSFLCLLFDHLSLSFFHQLYRIVNRAHSRSAPLLISPPAQAHHSTVYSFKTLRSHYLLGQEVLKSSSTLFLVLWSQSCRTVQLYRHRALIADKFLPVLASLVSSDVCM